MTDFEWLVKQLKIISNFGSNLKDIGPTTDYGNYTALKLIAIHYYSEVFSHVARSPNRTIQGFDGAVYIDLFGGTGLVKLIDTGDYVAGSATCALQNKYGFDYSVCVEIEKERAEALEKRLSKIMNKKDFRVINGDCNNCIQDVINLIQDRFDNPIVLTVVDPEGMEIKFSTLKSLSDEFTSCDFMVNVTSSGISRVAGQIKSGLTTSIKTLAEYLNEDAKDILENLAKGITPQGMYQNVVSNILGKQIGSTIPIHDKGNNIAYYILGYTRTTSGGSAYGKSLLTLKERLEGLDRTDVKKALDQIYGRTSTLDNF